MLPLKWLKLKNAEQKLAEAREDLERADAELENAQFDLDQVNKDEAAHDGFVQYVAQLQEDKKNEQKKLADYKRQLEELTATKEENEAKLAEYQKDINKINGILKKDGLKEETRAAKEAALAEVQALHSALAEAILLKIQKLLKLKKQKGMKLQHKLA